MPGGTDSEDLSKVGWHGLRRNVKHSRAPNKGAMKEYSPVGSTLEACRECMEEKIKWDQGAQ